MSHHEMPIVTLSDMVDEQEGDLFVLLTAKEPLKTRDGKPYFKVTFRDANREVGFPIWDNSPLAADCREAWEVGNFYKLRATYRETNYGPQLDIRRIREATDADRSDGFDPDLCLPQANFDRDAMFEQLTNLAAAELPEGKLLSMVEELLESYRDDWLRLPAGRHHHHAYIGGLLEHTLSVTKTCVYLADKYAELYPEMNPPLDRSLVIAGGILHDIGKMIELRQTATMTEYTAEGELIGHILLGRDIVREAAMRHEIDRETSLRLEHLIIAHQRLPEWGSPKPPMTPEALLVHYADDCDAKYRMVSTLFSDPTTTGEMTNTKNPSRQKWFRGFKEE
jgi:3'-5' exoribonuclease